MSTIYLLRHGSLHGDCHQRFIGQIDLPLAPQGYEQARSLAQALQRRRVAKIHCSDLKRCQQTAAIIGQTLEVPTITYRSLREVSLGEWEGQPRREVAARWSEQFAARGQDIENYRPPGGESFADCLARVSPTWEAIVAASDDDIVVIGHAGVNRLLLCRMLEWPISALFQLDQDYGCVNIIEKDGLQLRVKRINARAADLSA